MQKTTQKRLTLLLVTVAFVLAFMGASSAATIDTEMDLSVSNDPVHVGDSVTLTAHLEADPQGPNFDIPGVTVNFYDVTSGTQTLGSNVTDSNGDATYSYTPSTTGTKTLRATYAGRTDPNPGQDPPYGYFSSDDEEDLEVRGVPSLSVTKTDSPDPVFAGNTLTYAMTVTNTGGNRAYNVNIADTVPNALTNVQYSLNNNNWFTYTSGQLISLGDINNGQSRNFWIRGTVNPATLPGTITNLVNVYTCKTLRGSASADTTIRAILEVTKTDSPDPVIAGNLLTYTISVRNNGGSTVNGVNFADILPAALTNAQYSLNNGVNWYTYTSGTSVNIGNINAGSTLNFLIRGTVNPATLPGTISNLVNILVGGVQRGQATADTTVTNVANLAVTKTDNPDPVIAGNLLTYAMSVANNGPSVAHSVTFADTLPTALTNTQYSLNNINWLPYTSGQIIPLGDINVNQIVNFYVRGTVNPATLPGTITNLVNINANDGSGQATADTTVTNVANLAVTKTDNPDPVIAGNLLTYAMSVANNGPSVAHSVTFADTLPTALTNTQYSLNNINWLPYTSGQIIPLGDINVNQIVNFYVRGTVNPATLPGTITNLVNINANDGSGQATADTTVTNVANLAVTKTDNPDPVIAGNLLTYAMSVANNGPSVAHSVTFADTLPTALTNAQYSLNNINWLPYTSGQIIPLGDINVNQIVNFYVRGTVNPATLPGTITNLVNINANDGSGQATADTTVISNALLSITKTADKNPAVYNVGETVTFNINVYNPGPSAASNVVVTDTLPAGLNYLDSSAGGVWDANARTVTWILPALAPGDNYLPWVSATVTSEAAAKNVENTAQAIDEQMETPVIATASIYVPSADLVLTKTVDKTKPVVKDTVIFTLIVNNHGPDTAVDVTVTDKLPAGLTYVSSSANYGTYNPSTGIWSIGNLPNGATAILTIKAVVEKSGQIINQAKVTALTYDPNIEGNTASAAMNVQAQSVPVNAKTIGMLETGAPFGALIVALLMLFSGMVIARRK